MKGGNVESQDRNRRREWEWVNGNEKLNGKKCHRLRQPLIVGYECSFHQIEYANVFG